MAKQKKEAFKLQQAEKVFHTPPLSRVFVTNLIGGIGWVLGVAIGLSLLGYILTIIINTLGGLPFIGAQIAEIINVTSNALLRIQN